MSDNERNDVPSQIDWLARFTSKVGLGACICEGQEISAANAEIERLTAERDELRRQLSEWLRENSPGGWIDDLRRQLAEADKSIAHLQDALRVAVNAATGVNDV